MLNQTKEEDFNERFRNQMAGDAGLIGVDEDEEEKSDIEIETKQFKSQLSSGNMDVDM